MNKAIKYLKDRHWKEVLDSHQGKMIRKALFIVKEEALKEFNWMWKAYLKGQYSQSQFSRMFRKYLNTQDTEQTKEVTK